MGARASGDYLVLAVASGGGHWEELMLLKSAFAPFRTVYATTNQELAVRDAIADVRVLPDSHRDVPLRALSSFWHCVRLVLQLRPQMVVTTGALPGLFCLIAAKLVGARTVWIDSIAASDKPSLSGKCARPFADLRLTQWSHLAGIDGFRYQGALL